mgnify:CR=1 FL=1
MKVKAQVILEYIVVLSIVALALAAMQLYLRRGIQAAIKVAADEVGEQGEAQEIDPEKGTKTSSNIHQFTHGSGAQAKAAQRTRVSQGGSVRTDYDTATTINGTSTYKSERQE